MVEEKERPTGVTILAVLEFLASAIVLLMGLLMIGGGGMFATAYRHDAGLMGGLLVVGGILMLAMGIVGLLVAWGLWTGKSWAWWLVVIGSGLGVLSILSLNLSGVVDAAISALVLWYLFKPHVKDFFGIQVSFST